MKLRVVSRVMRQPLNMVENDKCRQADVEPVLRLQWGDSNFELVEELGEPSIHG